MEVSHKYNCRRCKGAFKTAGELRNHTKYFHESQKTQKRLISKLHKSQRVSSGRWLWWLAAIIIIFTIIFLYMR